MLRNLQQAVLYILCTYYTINLTINCFNLSRGELEVRYHQLSNFCMLKFCCKRFFNEGPFRKFLLCRNFLFCLGLTYKLSHVILKVKIILYFVEIHWKLRYYKIWKVINRPFIVSKHPCSFTPSQENQILIINRHLIQQYQYIKSFIS